jgi:hypothetical protein
MKEAVTIAFAMVHRDCSKLRDELGYLDEAITFLAKERTQNILVRQKSIQMSLYRFFELMEEIRSYALEPQSNSWERKLSKSLQKVIFNLNEQTNLRLNRNETAILQELNLNGKELFLYLNKKNISPAFHGIFTGRFSHAVPASKELTGHQLREAVLAKFSKELTSAYHETESILKEAVPLAALPEDEHFIEQITADYYPHIFQALQSATNTANFMRQEIVASESIKQFKIIQLGLNKIIDDTIARNLSAMKSQTNFLQNKVLGSQALSLNQNELEAVIETGVEETQKMREELYKKHVASQIEGIRNEYEAKLTAMQASHETELKSVSVQNWQYKSEIATLEAEVEELRYRLEFKPQSDPIMPITRKRQPPATIDVSPKGAR